MEKQIIKKDPLAGLNQTFISSEGKVVKLSDILGKDDFWESKSGRKTSVILTHEAVAKIAFAAGLTCTDYTVKTQPDCYNNYQYTVQAEIVDRKGNKLEPQWGEANRSNLGSKGRNNPANMAQKRAFDRTVLKGLHIIGLLSEEELSDENNDETKVDKLSPEKAREIAPIINKILLAKTKQHLNEFNSFMAKEKSKYSPEQIDAIRKTFMAKVAEINKTKNW